MCSWESESYVAVKGQSLIVTRKEGQKRGLCRRPSAVALNGSLSDSVEDGTGDEDSMSYSSMQAQTMSEIERYLHQMTQMLRPEDSIKLVVRLESVVSNHLRYLAVVSCMEQDVEESCLLGFDCDGMITIGLVLPILSHTIIRLDGDGGFCVTYQDGLRSHIFKPVSVQTMWSALQSLYTASECAKKSNSFQVSAVRYYDQLFQAKKSDIIRLNEWNLLPGVESKRPLVANLSSDELSFQQRISSGLREILLAERDLDEVSSKEIRTKLEAKLNVDLSQYKSFIDEEMLKILGQMDAPAMILDNLYLGTEWNASHQQDLCDKGIGYILNVTSEIDNFFPDTFRYMNIPVSDSEETNLLRYFNDSYRFINEAHKMGKNVLVHCKMGISRSATIVIAYVMKNRNWDLLQTMEHVKIRRTCVKPNPTFMKQLEVYEGLLSAKKFSDTLEKRSKSESNLKQSDFALSISNNSQTSSSNTDLRSSPIPLPKKSARKYYNTAPARLRPERTNVDDVRVSSARNMNIAKMKSSFSRPKSCSCAAIPLTPEFGDDQHNDFVQADILDSFTEAVQSFDASPVSAFTAKMESLRSPCDTVSMPNIQDWSSPPVAIPKFQGSRTSVSDLDVEDISTLPNPIEAEVIHPQSTTPLSTVSSSIIRVTDNTDTTSPFMEKQNFHYRNSSVDEPLSPTGDTDCGGKSRQSTNLKCCRRPYKGHTFSVSPNQVVNISSIGNFTKFSVRHLVNEFESQSNRNSLSNLTCVSDGQSSLSSIKENLLSSPGKIKIASKEKSHNGIVKRNISDTKRRDISSLKQAAVFEDKLHGKNSEQSVIKQKRAFASKEIIRDEKKYSSESKGSVRHFWSIGTRNDRNTKEAASNTIVRFIKNQTRRAVDSARPGRAGKNRPKAAHLAQSDDTAEKCDMNDKQIYGSKAGVLFQPRTGVVKQRLEAFEAKSSPMTDSVSSNKKHNRSHSATTALPNFQSMSSLTKDQFLHGHKRKTSMPHLGCRAVSSSEESAASSPPSFSPNPFDRKGSLDSNSLLRSLPMTSRTLTVRGFPPVAISTGSSKSSERHQSAQLTYISKQQHGNTHPLKLLPQVAKLTQ